jgi:hypothetical protein
MTHLLPFNTRNMEQKSKNPVFEKVILSGVFVGIIITLLTMIFDLAYVKETDFPYSSIINVSSLIFSVNLLFLLIGFIYYWLLRYSKYGNIIFMLFFALLTVFFILKVKGIDRTDDHNLNVEFRQLLSGIILIVGIGASILLPFLFHNKGFRKHVI